MIWLISILSDTAAHDCVSDEALSHLKSYKYSSVDRSLLSYYLLNPYVCGTERCTRTSADIVKVEYLRTAPTDMARTEHGDPTRVLLHFGKCHIARSHHARSGGASKLQFLTSAWKIEHTC